MTMQVAIIPVTAFQQNCALIFNDETKTGTVIDPGGDVPRILQSIERAGVTIDKILLTHGHLDHAGGAAELSRTLGVKVIGPGVQDKFILDNLPAELGKFGMAGEACAPDAWLTEGEIVDIAGEPFEVLHCPGHTPGHVVFVNKDLNFGIFGDVLFRNSVGRTDFSYGDTDALISGIKTKLMVLPDEFGFICGHGGASTIGAERKSNPFIR
jgi:glyoxylase-like metal-dependent hydrolase (beta-lactamase superfamily II)